MLAVSFVAFFAFVFLTWLLSRLFRVEPGVPGTPMLFGLCIGLGVLSPKGCWGSIFGSTIAFMKFNGVLNDPEYGPAGHFWYSVGFFLFVTLVILCSAGVRSLFGRPYQGHADSP